MNEFYMKKALIEAQKAYKKGDVPIGCIIIENNKIISKGYNKKENKNIATGHAEIIAIEKACKKKKTWHLENCILYTTVEPCMMCMGAITQSRIKKIVYGTKNNKFGSAKLLNNKKIIIECGILENESKQLLQSFFKKQRNKR